MLSPRALAMATLLTLAMLIEPIFPSPTCDVSQKSKASTTIAIDTRTFAIHCWMHQWQL